MRPRIALDRDRFVALWQLPGPVTMAVVSVAWLRALDPDAQRALVRAHLDAAEEAHADSLRLPRRRFEWLAGRLAAKHGVRCFRRRYLGECLATRDVHVAAVPDGLCAGQPVVAAPVRLSVSHSAEFAVAVCGGRPVGVDLERERVFAPPLLDLLAADLAGAGGAPARRLGAMPPALRWACKEAVLKLFGVGLRVDARQVRLTDWQDGSRFSWSAGQDLTRQMPAAADPRRFGTWARVLDGYALALIWN